MRTFTGFRPRVPEHYIEGGYGNAPDEAQFQGIEFDDGTVVVRWLTQYRSTSLWPNFVEFQAVHGHADYETRIEWSTPAEALDVDTVERVVSNLLSWGARHRNGDPTLHPDEWNIVRDEARALLFSLDEKEPDHD